MKEKLVQLRFKFIEYILYKKNWKNIPKGVRRDLIELSICIGQLTVLNEINMIDTKLEDEEFSLAKSRIKHIEKYLDILEDISKKSKTK